MSRPCRLRFDLPTIFCEEYKLRSCSLWNFLLLHVTSCPLSPSILPSTFSDILEITLWNVFFNRKGKYKFFITSLKTSVTLINCELNGIKIKPTIIKAHLTYNCSKKCFRPAFTVQTWTTKSLINPQVPALKTTKMAHTPLRIDYMHNQSQAHRSLVAVMVAFCLLTALSLFLFPHKLCRTRFPNHSVYWIRINWLAVDCKLN